MIDQFSFWYDTHCDSFIRDDFHSFCLMPDESLYGLKLLVAINLVRKLLLLFRYPAPQCVEHPPVGLSKDLSENYSCYEFKPPDRMQQEMLVGNCG